MSEKKETTFGQRLRGARIFRGYLDSAQAAASLGLNTFAYVQVEAAVRPPESKIIREYAALFGVTPAYLSKGIASTMADLNAEANVGCDDPCLRSWSISDRDAIADRLKTLRLARGYRTTSQAAVAFGWPPAKYSEIEGGRRNFSEATLQIYAEAFEVPTHYFLSNKVGPGLPL